MIHCGKPQRSLRKDVHSGQRRQSRSHLKARNGTHATPLIQAIVCPIPHI
jgi:hypothetical protein